MLIRRRRPGSPRSRRARSAIVFLLSALLTVCARWPLQGDSEPQNSLRTSSSVHHLVVLLDINPNQKKVLPVELALAEGVIQKLGQPGNAFSVITFGSKSPTLLKSGVQASEAVAAIRDIYGSKAIQRYGFCLRELARKPMADTLKSETGKRKFRAL